jgi:hypothetical protein
LLRKACAGIREEPPAPAPRRPVDGGLSAVLNERSGVDTDVDGFLFDDTGFPTETGRNFEERSDHLDARADRLDGTTADLDARSDRLDGTTADLDARSDRLDETTADLDARSSFRDGTTADLDPR